jgi:transcriptional regulator with XRE-family HTH domain
MLRLKELRQNKGVTQKEVAMKLNCTIDCYSKYERGLRSPDIGMLKRLSKYFGVSIDYMVEND